MNRFAHPAFAPYLEFIKLTAGDDQIASLNKLAAQREICHAHTGKPLSFTAADKPASACSYEQTIADTGIIPSREKNLHDYLNALVWLRFPHLKSAINLRHCQMLAQSESERRQRGALRDWLTLLDENGLLVATPNKKLLDLLRDKQWAELFWNARQDVVQDMRFVVIGHGLLEKCLSPFSGMTAKCLFLRTGQTTPEALDGEAARIVESTKPFEMPPLPVQGIPGWSNNESLETYLDTRVFRPPRTP